MMLWEQGLQRCTAHTHGLLGSGYQAWGPVLVHLGTGVRGFGTKPLGSCKCTGRRAPAAEEQATALSQPCSLGPRPQLTQREYEVSQREAAVASAEQLASRYSAKEEALWDREQQLAARELTLAQAQKTADQVR